MMNSNTTQEGHTVGSPKELARRLGLPFKKHIEDTDVDVSFLEKLPLHFVKSNLIFPLSREDGKLLVAMTAPASIY
ncbi:MAG: hypothetical protein V3V95_00255, partial [Thermodesulfobacteriota bacterium]